MVTIIRMLFRFMDANLPELFLSRFIVFVSYRSLDQQLLQLLHGVRNHHRAGGNKLPP